MGGGVNEDGASVGLTDGIKLDVGTEDGAFDALGTSSTVGVKEGAGLGFGDAVGEPDGYDDSLGLELGSNVGEPEGSRENDGISDGSAETLGEADGNTEGTSEGAAEGLRDIVGVGLGFGEAVGAFVISEGGTEPLGESEGSIEGSGVGDAEGTRERVGVGLGFGEPVGVSVSWLATTLSHKNSSNFMVIDNRTQRVLLLRFVVLLNDIIVNTQRQGSVSQSRKTCEFFLERKRKIILTRSKNQHTRISISHIAKE